MQKKEHIQFLREGFELKTLKHIQYDFSEEEKQILRKYGAWFTALMHGMVQPFTSEQKHFVKVCWGEADPDTEYERIWYRYISTKRQDDQIESSKRIHVDKDWWLRARYYGAERRVSEESSKLEQEQTKLEDSFDWILCSVCGGDGGAGQRCEKCSGTGMIWKR